MATFEVITQIGGGGGGGTGTLQEVLAEGNDANGVTITNLPEPSADSEAATKKYVDDNAGGVVLYAEKELINADIIALPTTPFEIVPALSGKIINFLSAVSLYSFQAGAYTNFDNGGNNLVFLSGAQIISNSSEATGDGDDVTIFSSLRTSLITGKYVGAKVVTADIISQPLNLFYENNGAGNLGGGNILNRLKVKVYYTVTTP